MKSLDLIERAIEDRECLIDMLEGEPLKTCEEELVLSQTKKDLATLRDRYEELRLQFN